MTTTNQIERWEARLEIAHEALDFTQEHLYEEAEFEAMETRAALRALAIEDHIARLRARAVIAADPGVLDGLATVEPGRYYPGCAIVAHAGNEYYADDVIAAAN